MYSAVMYIHGARGKSRSRGGVWVPSSDGHACCKSTRLHRLEFKPARALGTPRTSVAEGATEMA